MKVFDDKRLNYAL